MKRIHVLVLLTAASLISEGVLGVIPVDDAKIRTFLHDYLDQEEVYTGRLVPDRDALLAKCMNDKAPGSVIALEATPSSPAKLYNVPSVKAQVRLAISVYETTATRGRGSSCDIVDEGSADTFWIPYASRSSVSAAPALFEFLDASGKTYCNFFLFLVCQEDAGAVGTHKCLCPPQMVWQKNKCVLRKGEGCLGWTVGDREILPRFDFTKAEFTRWIPSTCDDSSTCIGTVCTDDKHKEYYATPTEIKNFLKKYLDSPLERYKQYYEESNTEADKIEIIRLIFERIYTTQIGWRDLRLLSYELHMETHLKAWDQPCAVPANLPFEELFKTYNPWDSDDFYEQLSESRVTIQRKVMEAGPGAGICDHFKLLQCKGTGKCDCKNGFIWDPSSRLCSTKNSYACGDHGKERLRLFDLTAKLYEYNSPAPQPPVDPEDDDDDDDEDPEYYYDDDDDDPFTILYKAKYFTQLTPECEGGASCEEFKALNTAVCLRPEELTTEVYQLQENFLKKFSLALESACSAAAHTSLFLVTSGISGDTFVDRRRAVEALVADGSVSYCKIREHSTCSNDGKCVCVPPFIPKGSDCVAPLYEECGEIKTSFHVQLDTMVLPIPVPATQFAGDNVFCPQNANCDNHPAIMKRPCVCPPNLHGANCDTSIGKHLHFLDLSYLPTSLQTSEGWKLLNDLHGVVGKLEKTLAVKYGKSCNQDHGREFEDLVIFLNSAKDGCPCVSGPYSSTNSDCKRPACENSPTFGKPNLESLIQRLNNLVSLNPLLCDRTKGLTCQTGACGCPKATFYDGGVCYLELGESCREDFEAYSAKNYILISPCRSGTECKRGKCKSTNKLLSHLNSAAELQAHLLKRLKEEEKKLKNIDLGGDGDPCIPGEDEEVRLVEMEMKALADPKKFDTEVNQHIRLMEAVVSKLEKHTGYSGQSGIYSHAETPCDPEKKICSMDANAKKNLVGKFAPSKAVGLMLQLVTFWVYTCIFQ